MTSPTIAGPTKIGGRYTVERALGSGATATVYLCRDEATRGLVAVKVLHLELAESVGAERFLREIRLTSKLDHPNIVPLIDSGADRSQLYCVLPYMEGGTLRDLLRTSRQLAIPEAIRIATTIAEALSYAQDNGLIHRDIKPENILFSDGKPYLGDFGIARVLHATAGDLGTTTTGVIRGTPAYMSPEQASGERNYDGRSDIYSLGCVLYEMISGMPPFVGPTAQSVLAQRFSVTPRPMRTYRKSVTEELEAVVDKAMALMPADRYATPREFCDALEVAAKALPRRLVRPRQLIIGAIAATALIVAGVVAGRQGALPGSADVQADTTQLAVLPFEKQGDTEALGSIDALMYNAFSAWQGITVLEPYRVRDAMLKTQTASGVTDHKAVAVSLGAGRFVRGQVGILPGGRGWVIQAWLYQVNMDTALKSTSINVSPAQLARVDGLYAVLASVLLLRGGASIDTSDASARGTTVLPALQSFAGGIDALDDWDFERADSMFQGALAADQQYARAAFWLAQVRLWRRVLSPQWAPLAERAVGDSTRLPPRERELALALNALGKARYEEACARYRRLTELNQSDFAAWFGLGRCQDGSPDGDSRVVPIEGRPGQWRYVASFHGAMQAYQRAFEVLSLSHRGMERSAFQPLRDLLLMRPSQLRPATPPPPDSTRLLGRLDLEADTLVIRAIPAGLVTAGDPAGVPANLRGAIEAQQRLFRSIATKWSTSLPRSAGAKEAVAVSLEMSGDRAALDTLRSARRLASDGQARLRLATGELLLRVKFLEAGDIDAAREVRRFADSIATANPAPIGPAASWLAVAAVLRGDCASAGSFIASGPVTQGPGLPRDVMGASDALTTRLAMGCDVSIAEIEGLRRRIATSSGARPEWIGEMANAMRFALDRGIEPPPGSFDPTRDYLARAQLAQKAGAADSVRTVLRRLDRSRERTGYEDVRPDAIYLESRLSMKIGDTTAAITALDRLLSGKSRLTPGMLNHPASLAALLHVMRLRGEIAAVRGDTRGSRWRDVASIFLPHQ